MFRKLCALSFAVLSFNTYSACQVQSILPDDARASLKANEEVYFKTAHAYLIINQTGSAQYYRLCNKSILDDGIKEHFLNEKCTHQRVEAGKQYSMKEILYSYTHFTHKGRTVKVEVHSNIEGECKFNNVIYDQLKVH